MTAQRNAPGHSTRRRLVILAVAAALAAMQLVPNGGRHATAAPPANDPGPAGVRLPHVRLDPRHVVVGAFSLNARDAEQVTLDHFAFPAGAPDGTESPRLLIAIRHDYAGRYAYAIDCLVDSQPTAGRPSPATVDYVLIGDSPDAPAQVVSIPTGEEHLRFHTTVTVPAGRNTWALSSAGKTPWLLHHCDVAQTT